MISYWYTVPSGKSNYLTGYPSTTGKTHHIYWINLQRLVSGFIFLTIPQLDPQKNWSNSLKGTVSHVVRKLISFIVFEAWTREAVGDFLQITQKASEQIFLYGFFVLLPLRLRPNCIAAQNQLITHCGVWICDIVHICAYVPPTISFVTQRNKTPNISGKIIPVKLKKKRKPHIISYELIPWEHEFLRAVNLEQ